MIGWLALVGAMGLFVAIGAATAPYGDRAKTAVELGAMSLALCLPFAAVKFIDFTAVLTTMLGRS